MTIRPYLSGYSIRQSVYQSTAVRSVSQAGRRVLETVGEFVAGYEASAWLGLGAPKNTPADIVDKLNKEINAGLGDPKIKAHRTETLGGTVLAGSPRDFGQFIVGETEKWGKVIRALNIKAE